MCFCFSNLGWDSNPRPSFNRCSNHWATQTLIQYLLKTSSCFFLSGNHGGRTRNLYRDRVACYQQHLVPNYWFVWWFNSSSEPLHCMRNTVRFSVFMFHDHQFNKPIKFNAPTAGFEPTPFLSKKNDRKDCCNNPHRITLFNATVTPCRNFKIKKTSKWIYASNVNVMSIVPCSPMSGSFTLLALAENFEIST